jgi:hypothetical protein
MNEVQIFQFLGLTFFAMGMGMLTNQKFIKDLMKEFQASTTNVFYGGLACLAIGFPLVIFYNVWGWNSSLIITIIGWIALIKGLALLMFPLQTMRLYKGVLKKENGTYISYGILVLGIILLYLGYFA